MQSCAKVQPLQDGLRWSGGLHHAGVQPLSRPQALPGADLLTGGGPDGRVVHTVLSEGAGQGFSIGPLVLFHRLPAAIISRSSQPAEDPEQRAQQSLHLVLPEPPALGALP